MTYMPRLLFRSCVLLLLTLPSGYGRTAATSHLGPIPAPPSDALAAAPAVLVTGVYFDPYLVGEASEAVQIQNTHDEQVSLAGWALGDGLSLVTFPPNTILSPYQRVWASRSAAAFRKEFGFQPAFEYGGNSEPSVPDMSGTPITLANDGGVVTLKDQTGHAVDAVAYGDASPGDSNWLGPSVRPIRVGGRSIEGQILSRKMQESDGLPAPDTDSANDWGQDVADNVQGKRVLYPGWDVDEFFHTVKSTEHSQIKYCVAPDNLFGCYLDEIHAARDSIRIETYALTNARLIDALVQRASAGVQVSLLLDGDALEPQGKWGCQQIEGQGGQCWFMDSKPEAQVVKRYDNLHAKWMLIDDARLAVGSENLSNDGMPSDDLSDGTSGTRGGALITDSTALVSRALRILQLDLDPANHLDIRRWGTSANDFPPLGFVPNYNNGGAGYTVRFPQPLVASGTMSLELVQCPENCLHESSALLGMVERAGAGDTVLVEQLYERKYWGDGAGSPMADPNLRLEAYINAARRGAKVQILLDSFYDNFSDARSNYETCMYVNELSASYSIQCRLGNPTGLGLHNKMVLLKHGEDGYVHIGSINGSETSSKLNRELAVEVDSSDAYEYWAKVFRYDWSASTIAPHHIYLPIILKK
jgi:PLD-like domain/Lamin Tail Domain